MGRSFRIVYDSAIPLGPDEQENEAKVQQAEAREECLNALLRSGATAAAAKAGRAFLTLDPPLPVALLQLLGTADLLSLSQVCRDLHVASYELMCREEAACRSVQAKQGDFSSSGGGSGSYIPFAAGTVAAAAKAAARAAAETAASDDSSPDESKQPDSSSRCPMYRGARRHMRCLSLLCGSPEAAAAARAQEKQVMEGAGRCEIVGSIAWGLVSHKAAHCRSRAWAVLLSAAMLLRDDGIAGIFKQASKGFGDSCHSLCTVRVADLPGFMQRVQQLQPLLQPQPNPPVIGPEHIRNAPIFCNFQEKHRAAVMDMAREAQRLGHALCLVHNVDVRT